MAAADVVVAVGEERYGTRLETPTIGKLMGWLSSLVRCPFDVEYRDDEGDFIRLTDDAELADALALFEPPRLVLRLRCRPCEAHAARAGHVGGSAAPRLQYSGVFVPSPVPEQRMERNASSSTGREGDASRALVRELRLRLQDAADAAERERAASLRLRRMCRDLQQELHDVRRRQARELAVVERSARADAEHRAREAMQRELLRTELRVRSDDAEHWARRVEEAEARGREAGARAEREACEGEMVALRGRLERLGAELARAGLERAEGQAALASLQQAQRLACAEDGQLRRRLALALAFGRLRASALGERCAQLERQLEEAQMRQQVAAVKRMREAEAAEAAVAAARKARKVAEAEAREALVTCRREHVRELGKLRAERAEAEAEAAAKVATLQREARASASGAAVARREAAELRERVAAAASELEDARRSATGLREERLRLQEALQAQEARSTRLQREVAARLAEVMEAAERRDAATAALETERTRRKEVERALSRAEAALEDAEAARGLLEAQHETQRVKLAALKDEVAVLERRLRQKERRLEMHTDGFEPVEVRAEERKEGAAAAAATVAAGGAGAVSHGSAEGDGAESTSSHSIASDEMSMLASCMSEAGQAGATTTASTTAAVAGEDTAVAVGRAAAATEASAARTGTGTSLSHSGSSSSLTTVLRSMGVPDHMAESVTDHREIGTALQAVVQDYFSRA
mmetsp:Transcript_26602/g.85618  ORF Transcript_26602/g.85618 Transcript_26602/m.85618 type:complete len:705 (+) Transcript_26602:14-2128(+)